MPFFDVVTHITNPVKAKLHATKSRTVWINAEDQTCLNDGCDLS